MIGLLSKYKMWLYGGLGAVVLGLAIYWTGYGKGWQAYENKQLKTDIGKGIENNEIISVRIDNAEFFKRLRNGKF